MDAISKGHLNDYDLNDLEQILGQAGVEQEKIYQIVNLWMNRHKDVGLNEKEEGYYKDPKTGEIKKGSLQTSLDALTQRFKDEEEQGKENLTKEVLRRLKNR
jgi:hypothetical protein